MEGNSIFHAFNNIYFAIFALFCFKLLIKISLALLTHFYIVKGNRKEAARIAEQIYGIAPGSWADRSPLHEAAFQGRLLSLKTLIAQGFNVNIVTIDRVSALHEACLGGHVACAKVLLENGAQVNAVTIDGITPLFNACCSGSAACVNMLLEFGATPQLENHLASPIHEAVKRGHRECMEILVANDVDIDQEDSQHGTPLYVACMYQRTDCVKKLLELGASVDLGKQLDTPLHAAVRKSSAEAVNLLTDYGASLTRRNAEFKCALDLAASTSEVEQALLLREEATLRSRLPVLSTAQRLQNVRKKLRKSKEDMLQAVMQHTVTENQKVQDWRERESRISQKNAADRKKSTKQLISILAHQADSIQALVAMQAENYCAPSPVPKLFPLCPNVSSKPPSPASRFLPPPAATNTCALTKTSPENYDHYPLHSAPMQYSHPEVQQSLHSTPDRTYSNL